MGQPQGKYLKTQFDDLIQLLSLSASNVVAGDGSVKSSAGTYTACTEVIEPVLVEVIRSCSTPISFC